MASDGGFFDKAEELGRKRRAGRADAGGDGGGENGAAGGLPGGGEGAVTVSELTREIKRALKGAFPGTVTVKGEISNYRGPHHSGHHYFSLKDAGSVVNAVMFANVARGLKHKLEDGMEVLATGRVDVFEAGGKYNLVLTSIHPVGTGALELAYRQLYAQLEGEGLFAPERKRPIPPYPRTLALVTSKAAAGLADMLKVLRRFPFLRVIVVHVPVQGAGAAAGIARALDGVNKHAAGLGGVDVILLGRGGGSYEDLFEFSREEVARAVARSGIPVITGIGHEVDVAIADLVADHHAHTPTAAAEYAVRMWEAADEFVKVASGKLRREMSRTMSDTTSRLRQAARHAFFARPEELTARRHQRVDDREGKLEIAQRNRLLKLRQRLDALEARLAKHDPRRVLLARRDRVFKSQARLDAAMAGRFRRLEGRLTVAQATLARRGPQQRLALAVQKLNQLEQRGPRAIGLLLRRATERVAALDAQLRVLGPESVLSRGFTITTRADTGEVVRDPGSLGAGDTLRTWFAGGEVDSVVKG